MSNREQLTEQEWILREVEIKLTGQCPVHISYYGECFSCKLSKAIQFGTACSTHEEHKKNGICRSCRREEQRKSIEGVQPYEKDRYGRSDTDNITLINFNIEQRLAFTAARKEHKKSIMSASEFEQALEIIISIIGKPAINQNKDQSGHSLGHRTVLWGVNLTTGVAVSLALIKAGIKKFWITNDRWLTIWIDENKFVKDFYKKKEVA